MPSLKILIPKEICSYFFVNAYLGCNTTECVKDVDTYYDYVQAVDSYRVWKKWSNEFRLELKSFYCNYFGSKFIDSRNV